jgi:hypothetical protein
MTRLYTDQAFQSAFNRPVGKLLIYRCVAIKGNDCNIAKSQQGDDSAKFLCFYTVVAMLYYTLFNIYWGHRRKLLLWKKRQRDGVKF